ncbi:MAG: response regulator transcription factor [Thermoplasmata archaeon]|nr:response regulator transcription factor [Thermoplasmata archaeon]
MKKVMIVDDEKAVVDLFDVIQEVCDFQLIAQAYSGEDAVETYSKLRMKPDLIIMDQRMPGIDGVEASKKILSIDKSAKILFVSADPKVEDSAIEAGAKGFIRKPFGLKELEHAIKTAMEEK